jgi:hypothetical protein
MSWTGYGVDVDPGPHEYLTFTKILGAFKEGLESVQLKKFDFVGFDACLMSSMEMLPMVMEFTDYYLASEDLEPGHGMPLTCYVTMLAQRTSAMWQAGTTSISTN